MKSRLVNPFCKIKNRKREITSNSKLVVYTSLNIDSSSHLMLKYNGTLYLDSGKKNGTSCIPLSQFRWTTDLTKSHCEHHRHATDLNYSQSQTSKPMNLTVNCRCTLHIKMTSLLTKYRPATSTSEEE